MPRQATPVALLLVVLSGCQCGDSRTAMVRPQIEADPPSLDFGATTPGLPVERDVTLRNQSVARLTISEVTLTGEAVASFRLGPLPSLVVEAGGSVSVRVSYSPTAEGLHAARLVVRSDATNAPELLVPMAGTAQSVDACAGVTCSQPPGNVCEDGSTLRVSSAPGTCAQGSCAYASHLEACPGGCANGACLDDPCQGVSCTTPPATTCASATTLRTFTSPGTCSGGACTYAPSDSTCAQGCANGACTAADAGTGLPGWAQAAYVKASNTGFGDSFGHSVALSADGSTLAVGAVDEASNATGVDGTQADDSALGAGAVYVFRRTGTTWAQEAYLKASNTGADDWFGQSVALSADGSTLAVGAPKEDNNSTGINSNQASNSAAESGAVYLFRRASTSSWAQEAYVKASNTGAGDWFGTVVALSADGDTLAVSAFREDSSATGVNGSQADNTASNAGAAYVFRRTGLAWAQEAYLKASNADASDAFGSALALSADGKTLAVGASAEDSNATGINGSQVDNAASGSGAAYVFVRPGSSWTQEAYLKASNTAADDSFGCALALSADGSTLAIGALGEDSSATGVNGNQGDNSASSAGATYLFRRATSTWAQEAYLKASNPGASDFFGLSIALSADGSVLAIAAWYESSAATGIDGDQNDNSATFSGAVYLFQRAGLVWAQDAYVKASNTGAGDSFGYAVALSGDARTMAISAQWETSNATGLNGNQADSSAVSAGATYLFWR